MGGNGQEIGNYYSILKLYGDNGKENGNYGDHRGYAGSGIMERNMETTIIACSLGCWALV